MTYTPCNNCTARVLMVLAMLVLTAPLLAAQERPALINGRPNLNGLWQAVNSAHWNLEAHAAHALPQSAEMGAIAAVPAGQSVVVGGTIPYLPQALAKREENRAGWPATDPEASCYLPGIPRATYMPYPFRIIQGEDDLMFAYSYAAANRVIHMQEHSEAPVDMWMGWSNGHWEGNTLVIEVSSNDDRTWLDRAGNHHSYMMKVTERYTPLSSDHMMYEATMDDPLTFSAPWTIRMPLYRILDQNAELLEFKCIEFAEEFLYGEFYKRD
ncbi:MAG: hypothetical protein RQ899_04020 [Pseudomonadales bacterium]|nr:hypothetical protein [Pseudomonadales bacterium]